MSTLSFEPLIPPTLWLTLALAGAALLGWYAWHRPGAVPRQRWAGILALMAVGLALVLFILLNPTWVEPVTPPAGKPVLTVLVDSSASMATPDAAGGKSRFDGAARLAQTLARELNDRFEVRVATFAGSLSPADAETLAAQRPEGAITDLAAAVAGSLEENRPEGQTLVLLSDGIHNAGGGAAPVLEAVRVAKAMACPVYTHTLGGEAAVQDLAVELRSPQELAYVGQKVPISVLLRQRGLSGGLATVVFTHEGKEIERRQTALPAEGAAELRFHVRQEKLGLYRYEVRVEPFPGEVSLVNNTATLLLRVVDEPIRVVLLEGKPYWDGKFLMRTLLADPSIQLESVIRVSDGRFHHRILTREKRDQGADAPRSPKEKPADAPFPVKEEWQILNGLHEFQAKLDNLRGYQVLVLGRDADVYLTDAMLAQVRHWMFRDGGSLVCYRGQPTAQVNQRLAQLMPVKWAAARESRFRVSLTERGRDLRWFPAAGTEAPGATLAQLPTLATTARAEQPRPLAVVLATAAAQGAEDSPAVTFQPYGAGRVVVIEGAGMWRWAFLPLHQQQHDEVYRSLWHSLMRWLVSSADLLPGQKLALRGDKVSFSTVEPATATLLLRDEAAQAQVPQVELRGDGIDKPRVLTPAPLGDEPGTFRFVFGRLPEGRYQARVVGAAEGDTAASVAFDVRSLFEEQLDLQARPDLMARIAQESGGAVLAGGDPRAIVAQFREHREQSRPQRVRRLSAWDRWWVLVGVFAVWGTAWGLRRSGGLV